MTLFLSSPDLPDSLLGQSDLEPEHLRLVMAGNA